MITFVGRLWEGHVAVTVLLRDELLIGANGQGSLLLTLDQWHDLRSLNNDTDNGCWVTSWVEYEDTVGEKAPA